MLSKHFGKLTTKSCGMPGRYLMTDNLMRAPVVCLPNQHRAFLDDEFKHYWTLLPLEDHIRYLAHSAAWDPP